ncbi:MAG: hypothetical protein K2X48_05670 [Chitinophagaceae bacterium]|nr:hypothetical protein [Chitinophagaceae bacterium]
MKAVYHALGNLAGEVVFVGGATVALYAERPYSDARPTDDVDIPIELTHYKGYAAIEAQLRKKGFENDTESRVICRYKIQGITVDVMPTSDAVLGFANQWYPDAFTHSQKAVLDEHVTVNIFHPVFFIAAKLEAYKNRGGNDGRTSTDFEDIVFILNKRNSIWQELRNAPVNVKSFLKETFAQWLNEKYIDEWISCHIDFDEQRRVDFILQSLEEFVKEANK